MSLKKITGNIEKIEIKQNQKKLKRGSHEITRDDKAKKNYESML